VQGCPTVLQPQRETGRAPPPPSPPRMYMENRDGARFFSASAAGMKRQQVTRQENRQRQERRPNPSRETRRHPPARQVW